MVLNGNKQIKRLVIYFFYDADGVVDRYVPHLLQDIRKNCSELCVVSNGALTEESAAALRPFTDKLLLRENTGFDVWAYKEAMESYGWGALAAYDEMVLMNFTIMGPLYPFSEMFETMAGRDLDFWGITRYGEVPYDPFYIKYGYIPTHIQSHFIAIRRPMLCSMEFQNYWAERPPIRSYEDAVGQHEAIFTKTFSDMGYRWAVYCDSEELEQYSCCPILYAPVTLIRDYRCPVFKRRSFFHDASDFYSNRDKTVAKDLLEYLRSNTAYDLDLLWENLLRSCHMSDVKDCQNLNYILSSDTAEEALRPGLKTALVLHLYYEDQLADCYRYALSMPAESDVLITTDTEEKKQAVEQLFRHGPWRSVRVLLIPNRGRDVSALLVGAAPYLRDYDYVCFVHDKKGAFLSWEIVGADFSRRCFSNLLCSPAFVENVLALFEREPRLGMLMPPPPNHANYYITLGHEWGSNYENTLRLHRELGLRCPIAEDKAPISPLGTMFWFRPKALQKLFDRGWRYEDFPPEPNGSDGTLLHAIERIYGYVAQDAGYYAAWLLSERNAQEELSKQSYMLRKMTSSFLRSYGYTLVYAIDARTDEYLQQPKRKYNPTSLRGAIKAKLRNMTPKFLWKIIKRIYHLFGGHVWDD